MEAMKQIARILYVDESPLSRRVEAILKSNDVNYTKYVVSKKEVTAPTLVTSEGEFSGADNIEWYAKRFANAKWQGSLR